MTYSTSSHGPEDVRVGVANPFALAEALLGRVINQNSSSVTKLLSDVMQCEYQELFDMKFNSVLYAGWKFNTKNNTAEPVDGKDIRTLEEKDLETPDMSKYKKVSDLREAIKDIDQAPIRDIQLRNGYLHLLIKPHDLGRRISNSAVTMTVFELCLPFRQEKEKWQPANSTWRDMHHLLQQDAMAHEILRRKEERKEIKRFHLPVQGAVANSWLIAAIFAVAWADPSRIMHRTAACCEHSGNEKKNQVTSIRLYSKGGKMDAPTQTVEVNDEILINNSTNMPLYCRSTHFGDLYPALYEKAFAKWLTKDSSMHPDITQTAGGDPVKAMAQMNDRTPKYYFVESHGIEGLFGMIRSNCMGSMTINPMTAWTVASHEYFRGCNLVGNHAYTILGWASQEGHSYVVLRNPWGVNETTMMCSSPGMISDLTSEFWRPINMIDSNGVFALSMNSFKHCFAGMGVAK